MRNLFLLLLLANLGVLAVFNWIVDRPDVRPPYSGPTITLLREQRDATGPAAVTENTPAAAIGQLPLEANGSVSARSQPSTVGSCISIGPFAESGAEAAMATLRDAGFEPRRALREAEVWDGYWVYIEGIENMDAARRIQAELADNGIDDTLIIASADSGVLISLGVFREIARAGNQAERVNQIGYDATISDNLTTTEANWLDVTLTGEESIALELLQAPGTISRLEQVACPSGPGG